MPRLDRLRYLPLSSQPLTEGYFTHTPLVTHQSASPTWLIRRSRHRVWLKDVQLYVFCQRYRQANQRQNKASAFEIYFVSEEASKRFLEVFYPPSEPTVTTESSDTTENVVAGPSGS